jgi:hypothetical protein
MMKLIARLMMAFLALTLALPTAGCQQKENVEKSNRPVDVQIDTGKTKVKVESSKKPDAKGGNIDVKVERNPSPEHKPGDKSR